MINNIIKKLLFSKKIRYLIKKLLIAKAKTKLINRF